MRQCGDVHWKTVQVAGRSDAYGGGTEDAALGKSTNGANLIAIFERVIDLITSKLFQKENPKTMWSIARSR